MILSGVQAVSTSSPASDVSGKTSAPLKLAVGDLVTGRVEQLSPDGRGALRVGGEIFTFSGGNQLSQGEQLRLQVLRLQPDITLKLVSTTSKIARQAAQSPERSLLNTTEILGRLLGDRATLPTALQESMPSISREALLQGHTEALGKLFKPVSPRILSETLQNLRQTPEGEKLVDLLAMQDILPRSSTSNDGLQLLGYRLFWLDKEGTGEALWYRNNEQGGADEEASTVTLLFSLAMTRLGAVHVKIHHRKSQVMIGITAENQEVLAALRGDVTTLRARLQTAGIALRGLEFSGLTPAEFHLERRKALGITTGFSTRV